MKRYKIRSSIDYIEIQRFLFSKGYTWSDGTSQVEDSQELLFEIERKVVYRVIKGRFDYIDETEISLIGLKKLFHYL